jgi:glycosyltransferase involved in cell wall biosynthesis
MAGPPVVQLAGYLDATVGVGEAARRYLHALRSVGVEVLPLDLGLPGRDSACSELAPGSAPPEDAVTCNLLCLNPEQLGECLTRHPSLLRPGRQSVGVWSWEVDVLPHGWRDAARNLRAVWTYSRFSARHMTAGLGVPVVSMPPPVSMELGSVLSGVTAPGGFRFLVMFDYLSTLERKNPLGAIAAYRRAFSAHDGTVLVVKSVNGRHRRAREAEVIAASEDRGDILRIDETMSGRRTEALLQSCDCLISLHRSEGHGLALADAMAYGKPVVATGFGGNTEFMSAANSYLVNWTQGRVGEGVEHYPAGAAWAEPDVEHAAALLRQVHADSEEARRRGERAKHDVRAALAPEVVGARMREQLEGLAPTPPPLPGWTQRLSAVARRSRLLGRRADERAGARVA